MLREMVQAYDSSCPNCQITADQREAYRRQVVSLREMMNGVAANITTALKVYPE